MTRTRREFLEQSAAAWAVLGLGLPAAAHGFVAPPIGEWPGSASLRILFLGGTGFIGPHMVRRALERGHTPTLFNRGRTNPHLFPEVERLTGDRDGGLGVLAGRQVGRRHRHVRVCAAPGQGLGRTPERRRRPISLHLHDRCLPHLQYHRHGRGRADGRARGSHDRRRELLLRASQGSVRAGGPDRVPDGRDGRASDLDRGPRRSIDALPPIGFSVSTGAERCSRPAIPLTRSKSSTPAIWPTSSSTSSKRTPSEPTTPSDRRPSSPSPSSSTGFAPSRTRPHASLGSTPTFWPNTRCTRGGTSPLVASARGLPRPAGDEHRRGNGFGLISRSRSIAAGLSFRPLAVTARTRWTGS